MSDAPPVGPDDLITLQEAADRLKVHYMTAYRWVRRGDLAAFKAGGRLRVRVADVDRFVHQRRVDVATPTTPGRTAWRMHADRLYDLLVEGRAVDSVQLVRKVIADGAPAGHVYMELLTPVLHRVGDSWASGALSVADEHRASEICAGIVARLSDSFRRRGPSRGTAVTLTPPGELHGIAAAMAADFLRAGGYEVHHLGINVPLLDLRLFLQVVPCNVVCASVTGPGTTQSAYAEMVAAANTADERPIVVFGGQGVDEEAAVAAGGIAIASLGELIPAIESHRRSP